MPTYQVYVNKNQLTKEQKNAVAKAITEGHVEKTGAPRYYIQVIIHEIDDENRYVGGIQFGKHMWIRGDVRCRTAEENKELMLELVKRVHEASGFDKNFIWCDLNSIEPSNIIKFGTVFPSAGQEQVWYDALPESVKDTINLLLEGKD